MSLPSELRFRTAGILGQGMLAGLFATVRRRVRGDEHYLRFRRAGEPVVFVFWHGRMLPLVYHHRDEGAVVLVSEHADGEYIARVLRRHGFGTVRGSSTRGAVKGLKGLIRAARDGHDLGITPDGPRGPAEEFKWGALVAAQTTGLPVIPVSAGASAAWHFESWDRFMVPRPLSVVRIAYGPPRWIERKASESDVRRHARELEAELRRLGEWVDAAGEAEDREEGGAP